jgi:hypothetical protein
MNDIFFLSLDHENDDDDDDDDDEESLSKKLNYLKRIVRRLYSTTEMTIVFHIPDKIRL